MKKSRIIIQCNQTDCIHNSEYTINNEHECSLINPSLSHGLKNKRICDSYERETVSTTTDLLEIDETKEILPKRTYSRGCEQCGLMNSESCNTCLNLPPQ